MSASAKTVSRRKARELALQVLYAVDHSESARARKGSGDAPDAAEAEPASSVPQVDARPTRRLPVDLPARPERRSRPVFPVSDPASPEQTFESVAEHFEMAPGARDFARRLALETHAHIEEVDELIGAHARNWRVDRMAVVDRNILRLASYELRFTDTPTAVVLDEAVSLARRFGDDPSPGFVNGILDAIAQGLRPTPG